MIRDTSFSAPEVHTNDNLQYIESGNNKNKCTGSVDGIRNLRSKVGIIGQQQE